jgi:hypothetical protein
VSASRTSSSLNGLMTAMMIFIGLAPVSRGAVGSRPHRALAFKAERESAPSQRPYKARAIAFIAMATI